MRTCGHVHCFRSFRVRVDKSEVIVIVIVIVIDFRIFMPTRALNQLLQFELEWFNTVFGVTFSSFVNFIFVLRFN